MAGISQVERDLDAVARGFAAWFAARHPDAGPVTLSPLRRNESSGFSSETLLFDLTRAEGGALRTAPLVLRLPPAGGGLFAEYDLGRQAAVQCLVADAGIPAPAPAIHEPDTAWLGSPFLMMPHIAGDIPGDFAYPFGGWLHDGGEGLQRRCYDTFVDTLIALHTLPVTPAATEVLRRPAGTGLRAEIAWWAGYLRWASDGQPTGVMVDAYDWALATAPPDVDPPSLTWGDARWANAVYDDGGTVCGLLDWEQAAIGPAELDVGWWLAARRQVCTVLGVGDPELPGFVPRAATLARWEAGLGRPLRALAWHEAFGAIRMGTCIVATQRLLRQLDRDGAMDRLILAHEPLPEWTVARIRGE